MLPVSGAEQLKASGARCERPMISHKRRVFEVGEAGAVLGMRQEQIPEILGSRLALQLLHDRGGLPRIAVAAVSLHLFLEARLRRIDVRLHERGQLLLQVPHLVAVREIHAYPLNRSNAVE